MTSTADVDLSKVIFNPSKSVTFIPVEKKQAVEVEVANNCACPVAIKFKNTSPLLFRTTPSKGKLAVGEKMTFKCMFKGQVKSKCKTNDRFTIVYMATSKHANVEKMWNAAHKTTTKKHKINILFQGLNDQRDVEKETQQPTANNDEEEDKDRQGQMRSKTKTEKAKVEPPAPPVKRPTIVMFMRKELESISDTEDEKEEADAAAAAAAPNDDMQTVRPAGTFTGQTNENAPKGGVSSPDELKTTRPAGSEAALKVKASKSELKTTKNAGAFKGQKALNAKQSESKTDLKVKASESKTDLKTTKNAGEFKGQTTANAPTAKESETKTDLKTTKNAGEFDNEQAPNK